jgi:hypothetical protein
MAKTKVLWLDDLRPVPADTENEEYWCARTFFEFKCWLMDNGLPDVLDLDHDLGTSMMTGMDCLKLVLSMHCENPGAKLPELRIHSQNPVGSENMRCLYENYCKFYRD